LPNLLVKIFPIQYSKIEIRIVRLPKKRVPKENARKGEGGGGGDVVYSWSDLLTSMMPSDSTADTRPKPDDASVSSSTDMKRTDFLGKSSSPSICKDGSEEDDLVVEDVLPAVLMPNRRNLFFIFPLELPPPCPSARDSLLKVD